MKVGDLVKHTIYPKQIGVVTHVGKYTIIFVRTDGHTWETHPTYLEVLNGKR